MKDGKNAWILFASLIVGFVLIKACQEENANKSISSETKKDEILGSPQPIDSVSLDSIKLQEIKDGIEFVDQIRIERHEGETEQILQLCRSLERYAMICNQIPSNSSNSVKSGAKTLSSKIRQVRIKTFPKMRKMWADAADRKLWENNVDVKVRGASNTTLEMVGGMFASNSNIKETQNAIEDGLNLLRFKRVNYKWYAEVDEYQYFTIKTPPDSEL